MQRPVWYWIWKCFCYILWIYVGISFIFNFTFLYCYLQFFLFLLFYRFFTLKFVCFPTMLFQMWKMFFFHNGRIWCDLIRSYFEKYIWRKEIEEWKWRMAKETVLKVNICLISQEPFSIFVGADVSVIFQKRS